MYQIMVLLGTPKKFVKMIKIFLNENQGRITVANCTSNVYMTN